MVEHLASCIAALKKVVMLTDRRYTVHTNDCPIGCTHSWTVDELITSFGIYKEEIESLNIDDCLEINCDLILYRYK